MLIASEDLRQLLLGKFPLLNNDRLRLSDTMYLLAQYSHAEEYVDKYSSKGLGFQKNIGECEEFSLYLRSDIHRARHILANEGLLPDDQKYNWALGEADGLLSNAFYEDEPHTMDVLVTDDKKIYYIENQTATIYKYDLNHFSIYRIWM